MGGPAALDLCYSVMTIGPIWTSQSSSFHAWRTRILYHKTDVLLFHRSSYICISVTRIFFPVFFLNANVGVKQLRGQGPPSRRIADKPKWRNFLPSLRHMGVRKAFTNKMRHKNRVSGSPSWSPTPPATNKSFSTDTDQRPCHCQCRDEGWHVPTYSYSDF